MRLRLLTFVLLFGCTDAGPAARDSVLEHAGTEDASAADSGPDAGAADPSACSEPKEAQHRQARAPEKDDFHQILFDGLSGESAGLTRCAEGLTHRTNAAQCVRLWVNPTRHCDGFFPQYSGVCQQVEIDGTESCTGSSCYQEVGCTGDEDCDDGEACACASGIPESGDGFRSLQPLSLCVPASCRSDTDCGGFLCVATSGACGGDIKRFDCQGPGDTCRSDADCDEERCAFDETLGHFACDSYAICE